MERVAVKGAGAAALPLCRSSRTKGALPLAAYVTSGSGLIHDLIHSAGLRFLGLRTPPSSARPPSRANPSAPAPATLPSEPPDPVRLPLSRASLSADSHLRSLRALDPHSPGIPAALHQVRLARSRLK